MQTQELNAMTGWTAKQRNHLRRVVRQGAIIAYWCSGRSANGGIGTVAKPGLIEKISGPLVLCSSNALHATYTPHRWAGTRVWVVALVGKIVQQENKLGALERHIIGEVLPEVALTPSVGVRLGRKDLSWANLHGANLSGADLSWANL
jgi:hypothetical protein